MRLSKLSVRLRVVAIAATLSVLGGGMAPSAAAGLPPEVQRVQNRADRAAQAMRLGDAKLRLGDLFGACREYRKTLEILPSWWMPHVAIVRCGRATGLPIEDLLRHAAYAVKARPRIPATHVQYGYVLEEAGRQDDAIEAYQAALRVHANLPAARFRLGQLLAERKRFAPAARHLEELLAAQPGHMRARWSLARVYEALRRLEQAEAAYIDLTHRSRNPRLALARLIRFYERNRMTSQSDRARARWASTFGR